MFSVGQKVMFGRPNGEKTEGIITKINGKSVKVKQTEARGGHPVGTVWTVGPGLITVVGGSTTPATPPVAKPVTPLSTDAERTLWNLTAPRFGLPLDIVGKTFKAKGTEYRITGIHAGRPKFPVDCIRTRDQRTFKFTAQGVIDGFKTPAPRLPLPGGLPPWGVGSPVTYQGHVWQTKAGPALTTVTGVITAINHRDQTVEVFSSTDTRKYKTVGFADVTPATKRDPKAILADIACCHHMLEPEVLCADGERPRAEVRAMASHLNRALRVLFAEIGREVSASECYTL